RDRGPDGDRVARRVERESEERARLDAALPELAAGLRGAVRRHERGHKWSPTAAQNHAPNEAALITTLDQTRPISGSVDADRTIRTPEVDADRLPADEDGAGAEHLRPRCHQSELLPEYEEQRPLQPNLRTVLDSRSQGAARE